MDEERVGQCDECLRWVKPSQHEALECYEIAEEDWRRAKRETVRALGRMNRASDKVRQA